jgi:2,5-diketo-D-gluconate reductase B
MRDPQIQLTDKIAIPQFGFGTWGLGNKSTSAVLHALKTGYRHLDSADMYHSHGNIGEALPQSGLKREDVFIVTKLHVSTLSAKRVGPAVDRFLEELATDYIDLLLIHWPGNTPVSETLGAMDTARKAGKVRTLGVSNFEIDLMQECFATGVEVVNNQIEYNLHTRPDNVVQFCLEHKVSVTSYSSLDRGSSAQEKVVAELAKKYSVTREEVLLNWIMNKGMIVIPRSSNPAHIESNFNALAWDLDPSDGKLLDEV